MAGTRPADARVSRWPARPRAAEPTLLRSVQPNLLAAMPGRAAESRCSTSPQPKLRRIPPQATGGQASTDHQAPEQPSPSATAQGVTSPNRPAARPGTRPRAKSGTREPAGHGTTASQRTVTPRRRSPRLATAQCSTAVPPPLQQPGESLPAEHLEGELRIRRTRCCAWPPLPGELPARSRCRARTGRRPSPRSSAAGCPRPQPRRSHARPGHPVRSGVPSRPRSRPQPARRPGW